MNEIKKIYNTACKVAFSINVGILLYGLIDNHYELIPLCILNCLLLSFAFVTDNK